MGCNKEQSIFIYKCAFSKEMNVQAAMKYILCISTRSHFPFKDMHRCSIFNWNFVNVCVSIFIGFFKWHHFSHNTHAPKCLPRNLAVSSASCVVQYYISQVLFFSWLIGNNHMKRRKDILNWGIFSVKYNTYHKYRLMRHL